MAQENWKDVPWFGWTYRVNDSGAVWSSLSKRILRPDVGKNGYVHYRLTKSKKSKKFLAHRIVALAFLGASDLEVNHKNGVKTDNRLENLEYVSKSENQRHAFAAWLKHNAIDAAKANQKKAASKAKELNTIRFSYEAIRKPIECRRESTSDTRLFESSRQACRELWLHPSWISLCLNGKMKTYKGWTFKFHSKNPHELA